MCPKIVDDGRHPREDGVKRLGAGDRKLQPALGPLQELGRDVAKAILGQTSLPLPKVALGKTRIDLHGEVKEGCGLPGPEHG